MTVITRSWLWALHDWITGWYWKLPKEKSTYTVERFRIPLKDGVTTIADFYQPKGFQPSNTLLMRTPYGIEGVIATRNARIFASRGYQVLMASCRGTSGSEGDFYPFRDDTADGHAVVAWMRKQPWYTGSFATLGLSYIGFTQWAILSDPPADMKAAVIWSGPHDLGNFAWGTGALNSGVFVWADLMTRMLRGEGVSLLMHLRAWKKNLPSLVQNAPLFDAVDKHFEGSIPKWARDWMTHPGSKDPYWAPMQKGDALRKTEIPVYLVTGWYDILLSQVMEQYATLSERGCPVALTVGPWTHMDVAGDTTLESFTWLDGHLSEPGKRATNPVRVYVTGAQEWRDLSRWPPPTEKHELYLGPSGKLSEDKPRVNESNSTFIFDPANPTPTLGSSTFENMGGAKDNDMALANRSDVLSFTTEPLDHDIEVCGQPSIELHHSTDSKHADLLVRLSSVDAKGNSHMVAEIFTRLPETREGELLHLTLGSCAHRFSKGTRIRVVLAGGSHPFYVRNLGSGESSLTGSSKQAVSHTIRHNVSALSKLVVPISTKST